ncbi:MAG: asparagine synthetase A [Candidatus Hodarchaeota archaeon]
MKLNLVHQTKSMSFLPIDNITLILKIQNEVLKAIHDFMYIQGLTQLMPIILSPLTDPLSHPVHEAQVNYLGQKLHLTRSMIFHKQIAIARLGVKGIFIMSPNVRLEMGNLEKSNKHLLEFTQLDIELKNQSALEFRSFIEKLIVFIFSRVKEFCNEELEKLGVEIRIPRILFKEYWSWDLKEKYGDNYSETVSIQEKDPFWITDFEREFYDREDPHQKGHYYNYDLFYPEGFGEALSGGERDYKYNILIRKIKERKQDPEEFKNYLELAKKRILVPSVGGGLGIERLIRFLTKQAHIKDITPFPKIPGQPVCF